MPIKINLQIIQSQKPMFNNTKDNSEPEQRRDSSKKRAWNEDNNAETAEVITERKYFN